MALRNMNIVTPVQPTIRLDFELAQASLINPHNTPGSASSPIYLLDGEFLGINADYQLAREGAASAAAGGQPVNPATAGSVSLAKWYPFWLERGRTDAMPIGKGTILFAGSSFEADFSSAVLNSADSFAVGDALYVNWLSNGTDINRRRGLTKIKNAGDAGLIHGYVTRVYSAGSEYAIRAHIIL